MIACASPLHGCDTVTASSYVIVFPLDLHNPKTVVSRSMIPCMLGRVDPHGRYSRQFPSHGDVPPIYEIMNTSILLADRSIAVHQGLVEMQRLPITGDV